MAIDVNAVRATYGTVNVGEEFAPVEYELTEQMVNDFVAKIGDMNVERRRLDDGRLLAPPSIIASEYGKLLFTKFEATDVAHTKASHEFFQAIVPPTSIRLSGKITNKFMRRGKEFFAIEILVADGDGNVLARSQNEYWMNASVQHEQPPSE